jgi:hypothetical protein
MIIIAAVFAVFAVFVFLMLFGGVVFLPPFCKNRFAAPVSLISIWGTGGGGNKTEVTHLA